MSVSKTQKRGEVLLPVINLLKIKGEPYGDSCWSSEFLNVVDVPKKVILKEFGEFRNHHNVGTNEVCIIAREESLRKLFGKNNSGDDPEYVDKYVYFLFWLSKGLKYITNTFCSIYQAKVYTIYDDFGEADYICEFRTLSYLTSSDLREPYTVVTPPCQKGHGYALRGVYMTQEDNSNGSDFSTRSAITVVSMMHSTDKKRVLVRKLWALFCKLRDIIHQKMIIPQARRLNRNDLVRFLKIEVDQIEKIFEFLLGPFDGSSYVNQLFLEKSLGDILEVLGRLTFYAIYPFDCDWKEETLVLGSTSHVRRKKFYQSVCSTSDKSPSMQKIQFMTTGLSRIPFYINDNQAVESVFLCLDTLSVKPAKLRFWQLLRECHTGNPLGLVGMRGISMKVQFNWILAIDQGIGKRQFFEEEHPVSTRFVIRKLNDLECEIATMTARIKKRTREMEMTVEKMGERIAIHSYWSQPQFKDYTAEQILDLFRKKQMELFMALEKEKSPMKFQLSVQVDEDEVGGAEEGGKEEEVVVMKEGKK